MNYKAKRILALTALVFAFHMLFPQVSSAEAMIGDKLAKYGDSQELSMVFIRNHSQPLLISGAASMAMSQTSVPMLVEPAEAVAPESAPKAKTAAEEKAEIREYVLNEAKRAGLNPREVDLIVNCESRWDPKAMNTANRNGSYDAGLWQINSIHKNLTLEQKLDYKEATKWAISKRLRDGNWSAWYCARKVGII